MDTDTERTPEECEQPSDKPDPAETDKTNTHWGEWEIACLLTRLLEGRKLGSVAVDLHRTTAACKRMLARLLDGETPCPKQYKSLLEEVREKFLAESRRHTRPRNQGQCREEIRQQYLTLAKNNEAIKAILAEVETLQVYLLALEVIEGHTTLREIRDYNTGRINITVQNVVNKITGLRRERGDLFNKPQPDPPGNPHPQSVIADPETGPPDPTGDKA